MGKRLGRLLSAVVLSVAMFAGGAGSGGAVFVPPPAGDAPVFIPGTPYPDTGQDDGAKLIAVSDDYILARTAGDTQLSVEQAGAQRSTASGTASSIKVGPKPGAGASFASAWAPLGPSPIIQSQRTDGALAAVSGRIGALAIRKNGRLVLGAAQGGVWTMDPGTDTWVPRTDNLPSLSTGALAVAPSNDLVVYDGTGEGALSGDSYFGNGILKSTDGGTTWTHVSADFFYGVSISRLAVDPTNANHVYATVLRGRGGAHRTTPPVRSTYGIWESRDGGAGWTLLKAAPAGSEGATEIRIDPLTPNVLYASFLGDKIYKSTDSGANWTPIMTGFPAEADFAAWPTRFNIGLSHPVGQSPVLYVGFDFVNSASTPPGFAGGPGAHRVSRVYKSTDGGASWFRPHALTTTVDSVTNYCGTQCTYDNVIETDPTNPNVVFAAGSYGYNNSPQSGGIFRSDDGGVHWKNMGFDQHPDFHAVVFDPNNSHNVLIGSDGGVWYSNHQGGRVPGSANEGVLEGADWIDLNGKQGVDVGVNPQLASNGLQISQFSSIATNPSRTPRFWGGTQDNGTLRKLAGLSSWYDVTSGDGGNVVVDPNDWHFVYGTYFAPPASIYRITDGGAGFFTNKPITSGINLNDRAEFYMPLVLNQENTNQLFTGTYRVYRSDNAKTQSAGDVSWTLISGDLTSGCTGPAPNGARNCTLTAIGVGGGTGVYAGSNDGYLWVSPDAQTSSNPTWTRLGNSGQSGNQDGQHSDVWLPQRPVSGIAVNRSDWRTAYVAYNGFDAATPNRPGHVFKTTDGGQSFSNITSNLPDTPVNWLILDPAHANTIYAATDVGAFVTFNGGGRWYALGTGMPVVSVEQMNLDTFHRTLAGGTHGRGAWSLQDTSAAAPALVLSTVDAGLPVGPGSFIDYTLTVNNIGNGAAGNVQITDPLPANTTFVSADGGGQFGSGMVTWSGLNVPTGTPAAGGGKIAVHLRVKINPNLASSVKSIVNDGTLVHYSGGGNAITGSPTVTPIAPPHAVSISPASQTGGAHVNQSQSYTETVKNLGYQTDQFNLTSAGGTFPVSFFASNCTTQITATGTLIAGATQDICVKVTPPGTATDGTSSTSTVTATSAASPTVSASATITTIAVTVDTLLVDEDGSTPTNGTVDTNSYYDSALNSAGMTHDTWDLAAKPTLPLKYMEAFKNIVWFTGVSYPGPLLPYERNLSAYLDNGGRLMMSGQDILDQAAGTTDFVHNYLHITWDGSESQNDKATNNFHGVSGSLTNGIGSVPRDPVLGAPFMDRLTLNGGAASIFTDDAGQTDGLSFSNTSYKVVFLAFGFEEYGSATDKSAFITRVMTFFNS
ncbi:MAG: DUF11 domain-containing protein [Chloroflexi bacterium]|nr:MAG: DUF11 domain-containing protein [Chloroflexota bacterium]